MKKTGKKKKKNIQRDLSFYIKQGLALIFIIAIIVAIVFMVLGMFFSNNYSVN